MTYAAEAKVQTRGCGDMHDITGALSQAIRESRLINGIVTAFVVGSTAGITTMEYESGLVHDMKTVFERIAPENAPYAHEEKWHDDNGHSHVRASLLGPSITVPFNGGKMVLGTWQQVVLIEFDTRPRERSIVLQVIGE